MANEIINNLAGSLSDYLISLAASLADAQLQLDQLADEGPYAGHKYFIPKLDFDLKVEFELDQSSKQELGPSIGIPRILVRTRDHRTAPSRGSDFSGVSTLSGSFVAAPTDNNQPLLQLESELIDRGTDEKGNRHIELAVYVRSFDNEPLPGVEVEANIDRERTTSLNTSINGGNGFRREHAYITHGLFESDATGVARTELIISSDAVAGTQIALALDCQGQMESLRYRVRNGGE